MNPMRFVRTGLRLWIALTSVFSFLVGWIMLAHSPKPIQNNNAASSAEMRPLPTLAPLPALDLSGDPSGGGGQAPQFSIQRQPQFFSQSPLFTTGGS